MRVMRKLISDGFKRSRGNRLIQISGIFIFSFDKYLWNMRNEVVLMRDSRCNLCANVP